MEIVGALNELNAAKDEDTKEGARQKLVLGAGKAAAEIHGERKAAIRNNKKMSDQEKEEQIDALNEEEHDMT